MLPETTFHRQLDLLPPNKTNTPITIIGAGGIGSPTVFILAKMGFSNITIIDHDTVGSENLPSQLFKESQLEMPKVLAIKDTVKEFTDIDLKTEIKEITAENVQEINTPIVISAVDSMHVRKMLFTGLQTRYNIELYIEARMGAEQMRIYTIRPSDEDHQEFYKEMLYEDEDANEELCTAKAIAFNTWTIGGIIGSIIKKNAMEQRIPKEIIFNMATYGFLKTD